MVRIPARWAASSMCPPTCPLAPRKMIVAATPFWMTQRRPRRLVHHPAIGTSRPAADGTAVATYPLIRPFAARVRQNCSDKSYGAAKITGLPPAPAAPARTMRSRSNIGLPGTRRQIAPDGARGQSQAIEDMRISRPAEFQSIDDVEVLDQQRIEPGRIEVKQVKFVGRLEGGALRFIFRRTGDRSDPQQKLTARPQHADDFAERSVERKTMIEGRGRDQRRERCIPPRQELGDAAN